MIRVPSMDEVTSPPEPGRRHLTRGFGNPSRLHILPTPKAQIRDRTPGGLAPHRGACSLVASWYDGSSLHSG